MLTKCSEPFMTSFLETTNLESNLKTNALQRSLSILDHFHIIKGYHQKDIGNLND